MTCVVGYVDDNGIVHLGADSAGVSGHNIRVRNDEKVFKKGEMIFGFTSSFRMGNILRYQLNIPDHPERLSDMEYMNTKFIEAVRDVLKSHGYAKISNNAETGGIFLVGYKGALYFIDCDFQVGVHHERYDAVGCGEDYAIGALYAFENLKNDFSECGMYDAKDKIFMALEAAEKFSAGVQGPFNFVSTEK
jgi:ATP-dependent protease HslVU (ClpYQ) peptidase subunit